MNTIKVGETVEISNESGLWTVEVTEVDDDNIHGYYMLHSEQDVMTDYIGLFEKNEYELIRVL